MIKLDVKTAGQIAAGEVVEHPAAVVKELLENALDAGAGRIRVILKKGGFNEITVIDDGSGIPAAELRLALERYATSKISTIGDLGRITSLGFRGEALPSIAAVSRMAITTCHKQDDAGSYIYLEGGGEKVFRPAGSPPGTMVTVKDLFYNVPVRRSFLKSIAAEAARVTRIVQLIALSHPNVSFTLERDGKIVLETSGDGNIFNTILNLFGHKLAPNLLPVCRQEGDYLLDGFVSAPVLSLKSRSHQIFYVNRRYVDNSLFREALEQSHARFVTARRYPLAFLFLSILPEELDINVHPSKTAVRFSHRKKLYDFLCKGITETYKQSVYVPLQRNSNHLSPLPPRSIEEPPAVVFPRRREDASLIHVRESAPTLRAYVPPLTKEDHGKKNNIEGPSVSTEGPATLFPEKAVVLNQLFASYILVQAGDNLLLIDQHAAHERILWEECERRRAGEKLYMQETLPFPQELVLPPALELLLEDSLELLAQIGLELEQFGNNSFIVRAVPFFLKDIFTAEMLADVFYSLAESTARAAPDWQEAVLLQLTCKAAVKANKPLGMREMEALLRQLEECQNPYYCPHGRPVITRITRWELEKGFHRR